jgi:hypothetical protein
LAHHFFKNLFEKVIIKTTLPNFKIYIDGDDIVGDDKYRYRVTQTDFIDNYHNLRHQFVKYMKYILNLYVNTIGKKTISKLIKYRFEDRWGSYTIGTMGGDYDHRLIEYLNNNYYSNNVHVCTDEISDDISRKMMQLYKNDPNYYADDVIIPCFKKILFKKISKDDKQVCDRFYIKIYKSNTTNPTNPTNPIPITIKPYRFFNESEVDEKIQVITTQHIHDNSYNYISLVLHQLHYYLLLPKSIF